MKKFILSILLFGAVLASATVAQAKAPSSDIVASAPRVLESPYEPALKCLSAQLTPAQKATSIGVLYFADRTGKEAYATDDASGKFLSQGMDDAALNALAETGMTVVDIGGSSRELVGWMTPTIKARSESSWFNLPDVVLAASWSSLDYSDGSVAEANILGIGGGSRSYGLRYTVDGRIVQMTGTAEHPGGNVRANITLVKDVVGHETKGGLVGFFGPSTSSSYVALDFDKQHRELLQYSQRILVDRTVYGLVSDLFNIRTCDQQVVYGDDLVTGQPYSAPAAPSGK